MKKIGLILTCTLLMCAFSLPCRAESLTQTGQTASGDVYAVFREQTEHIVTGVVTGGTGTVLLPDGTRLDISGIEDDRLTLTVIPVTGDDTDAWNWFNNCLNQKGNGFFPFEIYLTDGNGSKIRQNSPCTVTVTLPQLPDDPAVCAVSADGTVTALAFSTAGSAVTFRADAAGYYVIAGKQPVSSAVQTAAPRTGDSSQTLLWLSLAVTAGLAAALLSRRKQA